MQHDHHTDTLQISSKLRLGVFFSLAILAAEVTGGILTNSVALLADAGHVLTDVIALALSWYGVMQARRPASRSMTYGYHRIGVLIAVANASTIIIVAGVILYESIRRLGAPPEVRSVPMMVIAAVGLLVNLFVAGWLREERGENLNVRSAFWHAAGDALASLGVIVGGLIITITGIEVVDPIIGALIGLIIIGAAWGILKEGLSVLLEAVPSHIKVDELVQALTALPGVQDVHDVHVWSITPEIHAMSGHVLIADQAVSQAAAIQKSMEELLREKFNIGHSTLQMECQSCESGGVLCSLRSGNDECPVHKNGQKTDAETSRHDLSA
jgi:cobalt-zinc-cadmium efflux system protein